ncbi:folate-binding protein [Dermabacter sp. p3-SID358]|uniref:CAF17-like 4Fe-4S cluster assembly/insertion protein YgfZ n=1 Tax=Dermabacter sp. p3-SID358 TaxID=2916114 RepID=UPI0021A2E550|nr:folate-binding protein [Dermabacter sp. p3-SID358]MCT1867501.1 folate-binding protein [Dermabacter sp. p3-SID358]
MSPAPLITHRAIHEESGPDAAVPAHYGAPIREQRRLIAGEAAVDLAHLEILEVRGADRASWLTTVTSQVFSDRCEGDSFEACVLSPQGRVESFVHVATGPESFFLVTDPETRENLRAYLALMTFANRIELFERDDLHAFGSCAPLAEVFGEGFPAPVAVWSQSWPEVAPGGVAYGPDPEFPEPWHLTLVSDAELRTPDAPWRKPELFAGLWAAEAVRIVNHRPRLANEVDEKTIPHELDLLRTAVHTQKGCYRGQETVAKVLNLGQPPRRLVRLHLDGSQDLPAPVGAEVFFGAKKVGTLTSSALHADEGPVALAVIKRAVPHDAALIVAFEVGEASVKLDASQVTIVTERDHGERPKAAQLRR